MSSAPDLGRTGRALVTGAGRGLGRALGLELAERGWSVLGLVRTREAARDLEKLGQGRIRPVLGDVTDPDLEQSLTPALENLSGLEALVNNAGIPGQGHTLAEVDLKVFSDLLEVHCLGALRCTQAAGPYLLAGTDPVILNVSSRMGSLARNADGSHRDFRPSYAYRTSKAALNMLTVCLSVDPSLAKVCSAAVHPGSLTTGMGYPSADHGPKEAARLIADLLTSPPQGLDGSFVDVFSGETIPW